MDKLIQSIKFILLLLAETIALDWHKHLKPWNVSACNRYFIKSYEHEIHQRYLYKNMHPSAFFLKYVHEIKSEWIWKKFLEKIDLYTVSLKGKLELCLLTPQTGENHFEVECFCNTEHKYFCRSLQDLIPKKEDLRIRSQFKYHKFTWNS